MDQIDLFKDWAAAQTVTLTAALIAVLGVAATILTTANRTRREHRAGRYADALSAVGNYLEGPYRIRRKDGWVCQRWLAPPCQVWLAPPVGEVGLADPRLELDVDGS